MSVKPGVYRHYKGKLYRVLGTAKHSETLEDVVVYVPLYDNEISDLWVRPAYMFDEVVKVDGKSVKRFEFVEEAQGDAAHTK